MAATDIFDEVAAPASEQGADVFDSLDVNSPVAAGADRGQPQPTAAATKDLFDAINLTGEPRGGAGEFVKGLDLANVPKDVWNTLVGSGGDVKDLARGYHFVADVLTGRPIREAAAEHFPESQQLVGIEKNLCASDSI